MNLVTNIKNIGGKLNQRKSKQEKAQVRKPHLERDRQNRELADANIPEGRVGLMLDINA